MRNRIVKYFIILCVLSALSCIIYYILTADKRYVKRVYNDNARVLNELVEYFSGKYEPSLRRIRYNTKWNELEMYYSDNPVEWIKCDDEYVYSRMIEMQNEYRYDSDYGGFYSIVADYDQNGRLLLSLVVKVDDMEAVDIEEKKGLYSILFYAENGFSGSAVFSDYFDISECKPFQGNWYYWKYKDYVG